MRNILTLFSFAAIVLSLFSTVVEAQYVPPGAAEPAKQKGNPGSQPYVPPGSGGSPGAYVPPGGGGLPVGPGQGPGAFVPGGGNQPGSNDVTGFNLLSVKKQSNGNIVGAFYQNAPGQWRETSMASSVATRDFTKDWTQVADSSQMVVLHSGQQYLKIDLSNKQISFCQPLAPYASIAKYYDLSEPLRTPPGWGQNQQSGLNPVGKWLKGPPGIKDFPPEVALHMELNFLGSETLGISLQSGGVAEYTIPVKGGTDYWGKTFTLNGRTFNIPTYRLQMLDADTILETSTGHLSYMRRNVSQVPPTPIPNLDFGGTWVKGRPDEKNPVAGSGPTFTFSRTSTGLEMRDPSGSKAIYRVINGLPHVFMGQQVVDASGQSMKYGDVTMWRIFLVSPDTMIQTANGNVYYLKKTSDVVNINNTPNPVVNPQNPEVTNPVVGPPPQNGTRSTLTIVNNSSKPVQYFWLSPENQAHVPYGVIQPKGRVLQPTTVGSVWMVKDSANQALLQSATVSQASQTVTVTGQAQTPPFNPNNPRGGVTLTGSDMTIQDRDVMLAIHNQERAAVGKQPVVWSNEIAKYAQDWADQLAASQNFQHRTPRIYGENIAWGWTGRRGYNATEATRYWADEKRFYTFGGPINDFNGHYTQMIWGNTRQIGCGKADYIDAQGNLNTIYVCNYDPPGNTVGENP
ncbi:CAP domain-containing protein [Rubinisphaera italica]|uniref:Cysteine-rich secretory protein family protein n=1 Tax=Rubinisphaera italica TaxID=2527969 RepID=A0A5C5XEK2_9PLAN|nr:CAP domain-containing protein [Rubinisphaera italica]TWT60753.1 Cysteine-rich secretory protein family protein [Rubinisphaera italica]